MKKLNFILKLSLLLCSFLTFGQEKSADLSVTLSSNAQYSNNIYQEIIFYVNVTNLGGDTATGVIVDFKLLSGFTYVNHETVSGTYDANSGIWDIGEIQSGKEKTLKVKAIINPNANYECIVMVNGNVIDPSLVNNTDHEFVVVQQESNISLQARIVEINGIKVYGSSSYYEPELIYVGDEIVFNIYSDNAGPSDAVNVVNTIKLPNGLSLASYEFIEGSGEYDPITGIWQVGDLKLFDKSSTLSIKAIVTAKEDHQIEFESYSSIFDPDLTNNFDRFTFIVDVRLPKANAIQEFNEGDTLADLVVEGENIKWYDTDVIANKNTANKNASVPLSLNTLLVHNTTYYASQTIDGKESSKRLAVKAVNKSLSTTEYEGLNQFINVSPNPFVNTVKVNLPESTQVKQIEILNAIGQTVYTSNETELNLEHLPVGMYFVKVNTNQGSVTEKIIKN